MFTFVGEEAPTEPAEWKFEGMITRTKFDVSFEQSTTANTVWLTANWYNGRGEPGAACMPMSINLPATASVPRAEGMKIAA